jgi:hypothetical protein
MSIKNRIIEYIVESFRPIRITAPASEWKNLDYTNAIFRAYVSQQGYLVFQSHYPYLMKDFIPHPVGFISSIFGDNDEYEFHLELSDTSVANLTFNSKGIVANRWVRMLADFGLKSATIDEDSNSEYWTTKLEPIPESVLKNIGWLFVNMMERQYISVEVLKAPQYTSQEYEELVKHPVLPHIQELIDLRIWETADRRSSPSAEIFYKKCQKYASLYSPNSQPYYSLAACEGGINLFYAASLPWAKLRPDMIDHSNGYHDIRGHNKYTIRRDVPYEEIVVLIEVLKKEGAIIVVT